MSLLDHKAEKFPVIAVVQFGFTCRHRGISGLWWSNSVKIYGHVDYMFDGKGSWGCKKWRLPQSDTIESKLWIWGTVRKISPSKLDPDVNLRVNERHFASPLHEGWQISDSRTVNLFLASLSPNKNLKSGPKISAQIHSPHLRQFDRDREYFASLATSLCPSMCIFLQSVTNVGYK